MADKPIQLISGILTEVEGTVISTGVAEAGDLVALDSTGKLDISVLPVGIGADTASILASENLSAGDYVNIWNNGGTANIRLADNSNSRPAHGFVLAVVTSGNNGTVYFEGSNTQLSGLTIGARYYLDTAGNATATAPTIGGGAAISQLLGIAISATAVNTDIDDHVVLA